MDLHFFYSDFAIFRMSNKLSKFWKRNFSTIRVMECCRIWVLVEARF
jgi:hypothetical protein